MGYDIEDWPVLETPIGKVTAFKNDLDPSYPSIDIWVDDCQIAVIEYCVEDGKFQVHVWKDQEDAIFKTEITKEDLNKLP